MNAGTFRLGDFFTALFPPGEGFVELRALPGGVQNFVGLIDEEGIERFLVRHARRDIYFGVATRREPGDGSLGNCHVIAALWVDIDFKDTAEEKARRALERFTLPPSIIVRSGGGLHVYWLLREPVEVRDEATRLRAILRGLAFDLGGDLKAAEPARILRVPGTLNSKYDPPRPVTVETLDPERRYNLGEFEWVIPKEPVDGRPTRLLVGATIRQGERNDTLYRLGRSMAAKGFSPPAIQAALRTENEGRCQPPLADAEVEEIARKASTQPDRAEFARREFSTDSFPPYRPRLGNETNFTPVSAAKLLAQEPKPMVWTWEPFLPEGTLVLLAAFMKVGKSTFAYAMAEAIAQGRPFLGYPTNQGGVLILAVEEHSRDVRRRLERFGVRPDDPIHVHTGRLEPDPETFGALRSFISDNAIRLVILDTLAQFWGITDENDNAEVSRRGSPLLDLARQTGAVVLLVHHEGKGGGQDGRGIRGASALFALADQALMLERRQGGEPAHRVLRTLGRYDETPRELIIDLDGDDYRALGTAEQLDRAAATAKVQAAMSEEPRDIATLAKETGLAEKTVRAIVQSMKARGEVIHEGAGKKGDPFTYRSP